jgi:hypothetical protein
LVFVLALRGLYAAYFAFCMNSNKARALTLIGLFTILLASAGIYFWCGNLGICTFGKYEGKLVVRNLTENAPVANANVTTNVNNDSFFFDATRDYYFTTTDTSGTATIEFDRALNATLLIVLGLDNPHRYSEFRIYPKDIKAHVKISQTALEYDDSIGDRNDLIELQLEVGDWSLF